MRNEWIHNRYHENKKKSYSMNNYRPIIGQLRKLQTAKTESSRIRQCELITRSESEFVIKKKTKLPLKKSLTQSSLQDNSIWHTKDRVPSIYPSETLPSINYRGNTPKCIPWSHPSSWHKNQTKTLQNKKITGQHLWQTHMQKSSTKYEQTNFNNTQKGSNATLKLDSFQGCREGSTYIKRKQKVLTILKKRKTET